MKPNRDIHKSIRIPESTYKYIQKFSGSTWNDKINNMLDFFIFQSDEYKNYIQQLEKEIVVKQNMLEDFKNKINKFENLLK